MQIRVAVQVELKRMDATKMAASNASLLGHPAAAGHRAPVPSSPENTPHLSSHIPERMARAGAEAATVAGEFLSTAGTSGGGSVSAGDAMASPVPPPAAAGLRRGRQRAPPPVLFTRRHSLCGTGCRTGPGRPGSCPLRPRARPKRASARRAASQDPLRA